MSTSKSKKEPYVKFGTSLPAELGRELDKLAELEDRPKAYMIQKALKFYLAHKDDARLSSQVTPPPFPLKSQPSCPAVACSTKNKNAS